MPEPRSVVITGASRGLGLASATHLYELGWRVVGAMRSPDVGLERLRAATGAAADDPRLLGVRLDLDDPASIAAAAKAIEEAVGAPDVLVHNAGIAAVGSRRGHAARASGSRSSRTNLFGPVALTKALLPSMRAAGRGRIVVVSSQGGIRGMPSISAYSASKGALERWAEALAEEIAPFGLGVTILVSGTFKTDILTEQTPDYGDYGGPYAAHYAGIQRTGGFVVRLASPPERFARALARALDERAPFARHAVGLDARLLLLGNRLLPGWLLHQLVRLAMGLPRHGALAGEQRDELRAPHAKPGEPHMSLFDAFRFDGKRVLVVGGATGMGAAAAELALDAGADVVVMDYAPVKLTRRQGHPPEPRGEGVDRRRRRRVRRAGARPARVRRRRRRTPGIERINFIGHRHLIDRMLAEGMLGRGARDRLHLVGGRSRLGEEPRACSRSCSRRPTSTSAVAWVQEQEHGQLLLDEAGGLRLRGQPGVPDAEARHPHQRDLPRADRHAAGAGEQGRVARASGPTTARSSGSRPSTPMEQAYPLLFLCSDAASGISGVTLITDAGYMMLGDHRILPQRHDDGQGPDGPDLRRACVGYCCGRVDHAGYAFRTDRPDLRIGASIRSGGTWSFEEQGTRSCLN